MGSKNTNQSLSPELSEKVRNSITKIKETYLTMGGKEGIAKRSELLEALLQCKGGTDAALTLFRERVSSLGYEGIEKFMIPIVINYGTTTDKVALAVNAHFDMMRDFYNRTPLLSRKKADEIKASVKERGRGEMVKFMNALSLFDCSRFILPHFYRIKYSFLAIAYQSTIYYQSYEWLAKTEELINSFGSIVDASKREEFNELTTNYNTYLQNYQRFGKLEKNNGNWIEKQKEDCLSYAKALTTDSCIYRIAQLKGAIEAIEDWIKDNGAEMFVSMELREQMKLCKGRTIQELQGKYYHSHLKHLEELGKTPTEADKKIAFFPEYDEVGRDEDSYLYIYRKLDGYKDTYK